MVVTSLSPTMTLLTAWEQSLQLSDIENTAFMESSINENSLTVLLDLSDSKLKQLISFFREEISSNRFF